jgi:RNA polymerase sigma factor (sigma-70 family)
MMAVEMTDTLETYEMLVRRAQAASGREREEAFSALIQKFNFAAQSWAFQMLGDIHATQDAAQEAFITAYERLDDLRDPAAFPTWLRMIVRTQCNRNRRQSRDVLPLDETEPAAEDPAQAAEEHILHANLHTAVHALPAHERVVTELFYLSGYSQQEIAEHLRLPLTTIKKRLQYAREHLRETMPPMNLLMLHAA